CCCCCVCQVVPDTPGQPELVPGPGELLVSTHLDIIAGAGEIGQPTQKFDCSAGMQTLNGKPVLFAPPPSGGSVEWECSNVLPKGSYILIRHTSTPRWYEDVSLFPNPFYRCMAPSCSANYLPGKILPSEIHMEVDGVSVQDMSALYVESPLQPFTIPVGANG